MVISVKMVPIPSNRIIVIKDEESVAGIAIQHNVDNFEK